MWEDRLAVLVAGAILVGGIFGSIALWPLVLIWRGLRWTGEQLALSWEAGTPHDPPFGR